MIISRLSQDSPLLKSTIHYFWNCWGSDSNFKFYEDCILHSLEREDALPNFYILIDENKIIGTYALLVNDIISRQDLMPWLACLYVEEAYRNKGHAAALLQHGLEEAKRMGYERLYLSTDIEGFYEKKGWKFFDEAYGVGGNEFRVYMKPTK